MGRGDKVRFRKDRWVKGSTLIVCFFPYLHSLVVISIGEEWHVVVSRFLND